MANLYEITQDYMTILAMMEDPELDPQTLADTMEAVEGELEVKAENYAKVIRNLEGDIKSPGYTVVPVRVFINEKGLAKMVVALAKGKKEYDKRQTIKTKDLRREMERGD